jgi:hypothetical protein
MYKGLSLDHLTYPFPAIMYRPSTLPTPPSRYTRRMMTVSETFGPQQSPSNQYMDVCADDEASEGEQRAARRQRRLASHLAYEHGQLKIDFSEAQEVGSHTSLQIL